MSRPNRQVRLESGCGPQCRMNALYTDALLAINADLVAKNAQLKKDIALLNQIIMQYDQRYVNVHLENTILKIAAFEECTSKLCQKCRSNEKITRLLEVCCSDPPVPVSDTEGVRTVGVIPHRLNGSSLNKTRTIGLKLRSSGTKKTIQKEYQPIFTSVIEEPEENETESEQNQRLPGRRPIRAARPKKPMVEPNLSRKLRRD